MRKSSRTAIGVAALRAAHQLVDAEPRVLDDPVVLKLLGIETLDTIREDRARYQTPGALALRSHIVLRSRYAEDRLAQAVARGVTQYVILGAGLDTFAYRQPAWARELRIFEIDRLAMQEQKKERLSLSRVFVPDNVIFASIDFEREKLADTLAKHGLDLGKPTFFSWLGVTMYLENQTVFDTLRFIHEMSPENGIVFDYTVPRHLLNTMGKLILDAIMKRVAAAGEPFRGFFAPTELEAALKQIGYSHIEDLNSEAINARYFANRSDNLKVAGAMGRLCHARG
jgi:methyltransferase (TIGR00027 family)